jgi:hypothetical protein
LIAYQRQTAGILDHANKRFLRDVFRIVRVPQYRVSDSIDKGRVRSYEQRYGIVGFPGLVCANYQR